jgi:hypothetical protein
LMDGGLPTSGLKQKRQLGRLALVLMKTEKARHLLDELDSTICANIPWAGGINNVT